MTRFAARAGLTVLVFVSLFMMAGMSLAQPSPGVDASVTFPKTTLAECITRLSCSLCPGAEGALSRLSGERSLNDLAVIEYHRDNSDPYQATDGLCTQRVDQFYQPPGTPGTFFSGEGGLIGGDADPASSMMYSAYAASITADKTVPAGIAISLDTEVSGTDLLVWTNVTCGQTPSVTNLYLHVILVYDYNVMSGSHTIRFVAVKGIKSDAISLGEGSIVSKTYFTQFDQKYDVSKLYVAAFVQTNTLQAKSGSSGNWKEAKVLNSAMKPLKACEFRPASSKLDAIAGDTCEFNATIKNEQSSAKEFTFGYDPATLPSGWSIEITAGGKTYPDAQVKLNLSAGETQVVKYAVSPSGDKTAYIGTYAYSDSKYSDIHYIKIVSSTGIPEFMPAISMLVIVPLIAVAARKVRIGSGLL